MKKVDDRELIGKSIKDIEERYLKEANTPYPPKKYLLLGSAIAVLLLIFITSTIFDKQELTVLPDQAEQLHTEQLHTEQLAAGWQQPEPEKQPAVPVEEEPAEADAVDEKIISYTIKAGDCFEIIADRYYGGQIYAAGLARFNGVRVDDILSIGQVIRIPESVEKLQ